MAKTEQLAIELKAKIDSYVRDMKKASDVSEETQQRTEKSFKGIGGSVKKAAGKVTDFALAIGAAGAAITAVAVKSAKAQKEVQQLAKMTGLATDEFEALAFATKQFGITGEQIADISKDIKDKLGEFARDAAGPFDDFVNTMKITKEEGQILAEEFGKMSGDQVLGKMVAMMEKAEISGAEMTQVLESMGNDASKLIPLFSKNSEELSRMTEAYNKTNAALQTSKEDVQTLNELAEKWDLMTASIGNLTELIAAKAGPYISAFLDMINMKLPELGKTIKEIGGEEIFTVMEKIGKLNIEIQDLTAEMNELAKSNAIASNSFLGIFKSDEAIAEDAAKIEELKTKISGLKDELLSLRDAASRGAGKALVGGTVDDDEDVTGVIAEAEKESSEADALIKRLEEEREIKQMFSDEEFAMREAQIESQKVLDAAYFKWIMKKRADDAKNAEQLEKDKEKAHWAYAQAAMKIGSVVFEDNKAVRKGLIVADAAAGIVRQFSDLPYPAALASSAAIAVTAAAQLSNLDSASKGGGSVATASAADIPTPTIEQAPTQELTTTVISESGETSTGGAIIDVNGSRVEELQVEMFRELQEKGALSR